MSDTDWANDPLWYKDAIVYQVHVKSFFDSNDDGVGDFRGLSRKLDYIQSLGVNAIWLLPFYPSPMRDDGYDIADYRNINPAYGDRRDFRAFIRAAHQRGLKVITELVVNHTSDQHPWFQAARRAPRGSAKRNYYVWSDSDKKFPETRIIFTDTETSNWAWDPVAQQYYWHRFFSHQPDLNHNNPQVVRSVIQVMRFWLDLGVDGMRLDAIPYLCVREGTNNENLPETHDVIRQFRAAVDARYGNRMLLAEANQWPEDVRDYFGHGDECHMAYHFPLMPRMYMAVAEEDRHPIVEIMNQTPAIPDGCQWAIFLRNHDELTLEMVTDRERDYMYETYAADPRMRVNIGIRRRLAPLMDNDVDKIRLMNSLLLSMPGSPIIYYGDELGMGDNIFLGDRNGVRTPMQWSPDRNAGFSRADPQNLFLPPIMDPIYGCEAVNVEAQSRDASSLLNWMRRILAIRRQRQAFGRGRLTFIRPGNRKLLAYLREYKDEVLLCVANLARSAQPVELDLSRFRGRIPVELLGKTAFPPIGELPYLLTLPAHGFYWFELARAADTVAPAWHAEHLPREESPWLVLFAGLASFDIDSVEDRRRSLAESLLAQYQGELLPQFLPRQRWFAGNGGKLEGVAIERSHLWRGSRDSWWLTMIDAEVETGRQRYFLPLAVSWENREEVLSASAPATLARVRQQARTGLLIDAFAHEPFARQLLSSLFTSAVIELKDASLHFIPTRVLAEFREDELAGQPIRRPPTEGSNSTLLIGERLFLKGFRLAQEGINPEWELGRFLTEVSPCKHVVPVAGAVEYRAVGQEPITLALVQTYLPNQGDAWSYTRDYLARHLGDTRPQAAAAVQKASETHAGYMLLMRTLGERTAVLHKALATRTGDPAFDPEPVGRDWLNEWMAQVDAEGAETLDRLRQRFEQMSAACQKLAAPLLSPKPGLSLRDQLSRLAPTTIKAVRARYHGAYHLGQVLIVENDFVITDLEGEPGRGVAGRRMKHMQLKDLAGMLNSLAYARETAARSVLTQERSPEQRRKKSQLDEWESCASGAFLEGYRKTIRGCAAYPADPHDVNALLKLARIEKTLYDIRFRLDHRHDWLEIPLQHLDRLLARASR